MLVLIALIAAGCYVCWLLYSHLNERLTARQARERLEAMRKPQDVTWDTVMTGGPAPSVPPSGRQTPTRRGGIIIRS